LFISGSTILKRLVIQNVPEDTEEGKEGGIVIKEKIISEFEGLIREKMS